MLWKSTFHFQNTEITKEYCFIIYRDVYAACDKVLLSKNSSTVNLEITEEMLFCCISQIQSNRKVLFQNTKVGSIILLHIAF